MSPAKSLVLVLLDTSHLFETAESDAERDALRGPLNEKMERVIDLVEKGLESEAFAAKWRTAGAA